MVKTRIPTPKRGYQTLLTSQNSIGCLIFFFCILFFWGAPMRSNFLAFRILRASRADMIVGSSMFDAVGDNSNLSAVDRVAYTLVPSKRGEHSSVLSISSQGNAEQIDLNLFGVVAGSEVLVGRGRNQRERWRWAPSICGANPSAVEKG